MSDLRSIQGGKTPPHNLDAERCVLGGVLVKPEIFPEVAAALGVDDFFLPAHREIFDAMMAVDKRGMTVDVVALGDELRVRGMLPRLEGGEGYLTEIADLSVTAAHNIGQHIRLVAKKRAARDLIHACAEIQVRAYGEEDVDTLADEMASRVSKLVVGSGDDDMERIGDVVPGVLDELDRRSQLAPEARVTGVRFGIEWLDRLTCGGQPEDVIVVAGSPGSGKSALAAQMAMLNAQEGGASAVFSLEMSKQEQAERALSHVGKVNSNAIRRGDLDFECWKSLQGAQEKLRDLDLFLPKKARTLRQITAKAHQIRAKCPTKRLLLVIDYLQLIRTEEQRGQNRAQALGVVANGCKELASTLGCTIVLVSSLNRASSHEEREPTMSDLRDSGEIEFAASVILLVHNPEKVEDGDVMLILEKMRNGAPRSRGRAHWLGRNYRFSDPMGMD